MECKENRADDLAGLSFEACYAQLQTVLEKLEETDLPLDDSLALYETGMKLAARCGQLLEQAELRVKEWQPDGTLSEYAGHRDH